MKRILVASFCAAMAISAFAKSSTPKGFTDNLDEAKKLAKSSGRSIVAVFSGSDWCGWCKRLESEVFAKKEFRAAATNDFVLVFIDNPNDKSLLSKHAAENNERLTGEYGINGFPTVLILDCDGKTVAKTGYQQGGAKKYYEHLKEELTVGPLAAKHIAPFEKELNDLQAKIISEFQKISMSPIKESEREKQIKKKAAELFPPYVKAVRELADRVEKTEMPAELKSRKAAFVKAIRANADDTEAMAKRK